MGTSVWGEDHITSSGVCQTCASGPSCWGACGSRDTSLLSLCHWSVTSLEWSQQFSSWCVHCGMGLGGSLFESWLAGVSERPAESLAAGSWCCASSFSVSWKKRGSSLCVADGWFFLCLISCEAFAAFHVCSKLLPSWKYLG